MRQIITAGDEKEQVPDKSVFKTVFLQGIDKRYADRNKDGYVTGEELGAYKEKIMIRGCIAALILLLVIGFAEPGIGQDTRFQTTKEEMIQEMTKEPVRTRSYVPKGKKRGIKVVKKEEGQTVEMTVFLNEAQSVPQLRLKIEFDHNSYAVREESFHLMDELGRALLSDQLKNKDIVIKGHADSDGSDAYNLKLSLNRSLSVKNYLVGNFPIKRDRLKVVGYGESVPLAPNTSALNKQMNRRVEVQVAR